MNIESFWNNLRELYPDSLRCEWDNDGLMCCADRGAQVKRVLCALDATADVLHYAAQNGFDTVLAHHPMIFRPLRSVAEGDFCSDRRADGHRLYLPSRTQGSRCRRARRRFYKRSQSTRRGHFGDGRSRIQRRHRRCRSGRQRFLRRTLLYGVPRLPPVCKARLADSGSRDRDLYEDYGTVFLILKSIETAFLPLQKCGFFIFAPQG